METEAEFQIINDVVAYIGKVQVVHFSSATEEMHRRK